MSLWLFVAALWIAMLLSPVALLIAFLPAGRDCPRCASETLPIRRGLLRPVRRFLQQRWCMACGWEGVTRYAAGMPAALATEPVPDARHEPDDEAWRGGREL